MSDRFPGQLEIGGKLTNDQVTALISALSSEEEGSLEFGGAVFTPRNKQDIVNAICDKTGWLVLRNEEACYGMFEQTESALVEAGIPWRRWSDAYCEYDAEIVWWQPGMDDIDGVICDNSGNPLCPMDSLIQIKDVIKADDTSNEAKISNILHLLNNTIVEIPPLPKIEFIE